jgi:hypothetical protein
MGTRRKSSRPREDEREKLEAAWDANRKRRQAGWWPPTAHDLERLGMDLRAAADLWTITFDDAQGNAVTLRGERAMAEIEAIDRHFDKLRDKVESWNKKVEGGGRVREISGEDVMGVLEMASALTNDPAYEAAIRAMRRHRLDIGGLRRSFLDLHRRHVVPAEVSCVLSVEPEPDPVTRYIEEYGYSVRQAVEHVVADQGINGQSFQSVVDKVLENYAKREQLEAERQRYLNELNGLETSK